MSLWPTQFFIIHPLAHCALTAASRADLPPSLPPFSATSFAFSLVRSFYPQSAFDVVYHPLTRSTFTLFSGKLVGATWPRATYIDQP